MKKKSPYIETEATLMQKLVEAVNLFRQLELTHPSQEEKFINGIHECQDILMHRIVQRDYPEEFPTFKKIDNKWIKQ